jgi:predicted transcriptional regulator
MSRVILLSVKPKFVREIIEGTKLIEFRRKWPRAPIDRIVVYSSSPVRTLAFTAGVMAVHQGSKSHLWNVVRNDKKGSLSKKQLFAYLHGAKRGFAIKLSKVVPIIGGLDPGRLFGRFRAPQSYRYLQEGEYAHLQKALTGLGGKEQK